MRNAWREKGERLKSGCSEESAEKEGRSRRVCKLHGKREERVKGVSNGKQVNKRQRYAVRKAWSKKGK